MTMLNRRGPAVSPYYLKGMIEAWDPPAKPHCSNCLFAKVSGTSDEPMVTCAKGYGTKPLALAVMIRARHARQFTPAADCPGYEDMGPVSNVHRP